MANLWKDLDDVYNEFAGVHASKLGPLTVLYQKSVILTKDDWKGEKGVVFKCKNNDNGHLHNVVVSVHPTQKNISMWCSDTSIVAMDGEPEGKCEFWQKRQSSKRNYMCKHMVYVYNQPSFKSHCEDELVIPAPMESFVIPEIAEKILPLWKNTLIYGPTGSGKTHMVREMLKVADAEVFRINITDGYEDVDALQKLVPTPDGKGWNRLEGELVKAFKSARERRVIVSLEELTRSSRSFRNLLIKAMDQEEDQFILHDITTGERIEVPANNLMFVATGNINHADTSELDPALARRFPICLFQDYNVTEETKLLAARSSYQMADTLMKITIKVREQYQTGILPAPLDTGSLIHWCDVIEAGFSLIEAAKMTWLYRIVEKDSHGYPESGQIEAITNLFPKEASGVEFTIK